jgi:[ribosomal protein S5]-alanine N-acetyltransferase
MTAHHRESTTTAIERIETDRLVIRRPRADDAAAIFARYAADAEVTRYLSFPRHLSIDQTRAFLDFAADEWRRWPAGPYLIEDRADGRLLGGTGLGFESPWCASTGYLLARDAWGRGYATEAVGAMVAAARRAGVVRLYAMCHTDNAASRRVLEKSGFGHEGVLRRSTMFPNLDAPGPHDAHCYAHILG